MGISGAKPPKEDALNVPVSATVNARQPTNTYATGRQKALGHMAMVLFALLVAGSFSLGALAAPHIGPSALNAARFLLATSVMGALAALLLKGRVPPPTAAWRYLVLGGLMAAFFVTMFIALLHTDPVSAGAVFTLMPLLSAAFGYVFLGQVPRGVVWASLVFAGLGSLWVIFRGDLDALLAFDVGYGEIIFFFGVAGHAAYAPLVRRFNRGEPVVAFTFWTLGATGLLIALYGAREIAATDWASLPGIVWVAVVYLAVFTGASTFFLVQFASMRLPAAKVLAYSYLTPCIIIVIEGAIGHGWASPGVFVGALITVLGLVVLALSADG